MSKKLLKVNLVGMQHQSPPFDTYALISTATLSLQREPNNPHDPNAVAVRARGHVIGHIDRKSAVLVSSALAKGLGYAVKLATPVSSGARTINLQVEFELGLSAATAPKLVKGGKAGIYRIVGTGNRWIYIGQSVDINKRIAQHWEQLMFGVHANREMQERWNRDGPTSFRAEVVELAPTDVTELERQRWLGHKEQTGIADAKKNHVCCLNIMDGEVVATKRAEEQFAAERKQRTKQHNARVRERKKEIKAEIQDLEVRRREPLENYSRANARYGELSKFLRKNTGLRGVFLGGASEFVINLTRRELADVSAEMDKHLSVLNKIDLKISALKEEYRKEKTVKQMENALYKAMPISYLAQRSKPTIY